MLKRWGLQGHLLLAFFTISALGFVGAVTAMYSIITIGLSLDVVTRHAVPSAFASQQLSRHVERVVSIGPALLLVSSDDRFIEVKNRIREQVDRLKASLNSVASHDVAAENLPQIEATIAKFIANLSLLEQVVAQKMVAQRNKQDLMSELNTTDLAARRLLTPGIRVLDSNMSVLRKQNRKGKATGQPLIDGVTLTSDKTLVAKLYPLQKARFEIALIHSLLLTAAAAERTELQVLSHPLKRSAKSLEQLTSLMGDDVRQRMLQRVWEFGNFTTGTKSILAARGKELQLIDRGQKLLAENELLSRQLTDLVDALILQTNAQMQTSNRTAKSLQRWSAAALFVVVAISFAGSAAIVWFYVHRFLVARISVLTTSMMAIANGDLESEIPTGGFDEIGRMAKALEVFRDTAIKVKMTNLEEISQVRRRLSDAVESLSEGFALFDQDARLVIYNKRLSEDVFPKLGHVIAPGVSYADLVSSIVHTIARATKTETGQWINSELERFSKGNGAFTYHLVDGRWIHATWRKTHEDGTVITYADITELKDREALLAEKTAQLEHLSNQLAKYIPPQVYDVVSHWDGDVHIASTRKKLTVFFSDIAGFTETADKLESEEVTHLINNYLSEMSKIAFQYGGTIDKFMGDGIMIFFGDPETHGIKQDALACTRMAIAMQEKLQLLAQVWRKVGIEKPLKVRMGIHTGYCTVGNFGSEDRMDYTIMGSGANTASRLETAAIPGKILISYETFSQVQDKIRCKEAQAIEVKGMAYPVTTYQVIGEYDKANLLAQGYQIKSPNLTLDIQMSEMSEDEKQKAIVSLKDGLKYLTKDSVK